MTLQHEKGADMIQARRSPATLGSESSSFAAVTRKAARVQYLGNYEPSLDDLLSDDVLARLMTRDGVMAQTLRDLATFIR